MLFQPTFELSLCACIYDPPCLPVLHYLFLTFSVLLPHPSYAHNSCRPHHTEHGHGHSHGGHGHSHENKLSTINTLVATDDNENDERFTPPPPSILPTSQKAEGNKSASQMNMRGVFLHVLSDAMGE